MASEADPDAPNATFLRRRDAPGVFDAWAREGRMDAMAQGHLATAAPVLDAIEPPPRGTFLDVGCGVGYAAARIHERRPDVTTVAFDAARATLVRARHLANADHLIRADAARIPLTTSAVDAAFSMEVLYYLAEPGKALKDVRRVLRPGGTFDLVVDYYTENPYSADWSDQMDLPMVRWSGPQWAEAFAKAGFVDVQHRQVLPVPAAVAAHDASDEEWHRWARDVGSLHVAGRRAPSS
jgi:SAM-dependent methyltransferase